MEVKTSHKYRVLTLWLAVLAMLAAAAGCTPASTATPSPTSPPPTQAPTVTLAVPVTASATATEQPTPIPATPTLQATALPASGVPNFKHILVVVLENHEFGSVIGNNQMPNFNNWAKEYTLLTQYYAVTHPSLPNYIAMIGGDTFGIHSDCLTCYINETNLADIIEKAGLTWKAYMEDLPSPCYVGNKGEYAQRHDPFIYFDDIRLNQTRCQNSVVPYTELSTDLANNTLSSFSFIVPNVCNDAHDCGLETADAWLGKNMPAIMQAPEFANSLLVITWDEGQGNHSCCGLGNSAGGRVATLLISPLVKKGFQDATPYSHYSLLKTIETAWGLPELGFSANPATSLIQAPFQNP
ncbi:MAG: alkaline phosphatase family protein [Chloroflexi bacterium]|nr:alkaline phosphatase family protein [Chloroflexota bacterium]